MAVCEKNTCSACGLLDFNRVQTDPQLCKALVLRGTNLIKDTIFPRKYERLRTDVNSSYNGKY